jgi:hypothetical protein
MVTGLWGCSTGSRSGSGNSLFNGRGPPLAGRRGPRCCSGGTCWAYDDRDRHGHGFRQPSLTHGACRTAAKVVHQQSLILPPSGFASGAAALCGLLHSIALGAANPAAQPYTAAQVTPSASHVLYRSTIVAGQHVLDWLLALACQLQQCGHRPVITTSRPASFLLWSPFRWMVRVSKLH